MPRELKIGMAVTYYDTRRVPHDALLTNVWGEAAWDDEGNLVNAPCVNLLWVSTDENRTDPNGRQIERQSSVVHTTSMPLDVPANCWDWRD